MSLLMSSSSSSSSSSSAMNNARHALSESGKKVDNVMSVLKKNKYVFATLLVVLIMYAPSAAPKLSKSLEGLLRNYFVKFVYIFVLTYLLTNSVNVSLCVSLVVTIGALVLKKLESENFNSGVSKQAEEVVKKVETNVIDVLPPQTLKCTEASCDDAKKVMSPSCQKELMEQNDMTGYICNNKPTLQPTLNQPDIDGYVETAHHRIDRNINISNVGPAAANEYTTNNLGDENETVQYDKC